MERQADESTETRSSGQSPPRHTLVRRFLVWAFALSWVTVLGAALYQGFDLHQRFFGTAEPLIFDRKLSSFVLVGLLGQFMPSAVALWLVNRVGGRADLRAFIHRMRPIGANTRLNLFITVATPVLLTLAVIGYVVVGGPRPEFNQGHPALYYLGYLPLVVVGLLFGGLSEEYGWRGYLQPNLQRDFSPMVTSLIIAGLWTIWHIEPAVLALLISDGLSEFVNEFVPQMVGRLIQTIPFTIVITFVYNTVRGALFPVILLHGAANAANSSAALAWDDPPSDWVAGLILGVAWGVVALYVVLRTGGRLGFDSADDQQTRVATWD